LQQLSKQLLGICWTLCHAFTKEKLQEAKELWLSDASVQLGCAQVACCLNWLPGVRQIWSHYSALI